MARYRLRTAFDHQALDAGAKSEIREAGEVVEIPDDAIAERYLQSGLIELVDVREATDEEIREATGGELGQGDRVQVGAATDEPRIQQGETLKPGETAVLTQEEGEPGAAVVVEEQKDDAEDPDFHEEG